MKFSDLDTKMRSYETLYDQFVPFNTFLVLRLDGRSFSKVTRSASKPFDVEIALFMRRTCEHLFSSGFNIVYAYTQSDEISILFPRDENPFDRKIRKLNSVLAGEASGFFSIAFKRPVSFDARTISFDTKQEVIDYFRWRAQDCVRNTLNNYCFWSLVQGGLSKSRAHSTLKSLGYEAKKQLLIDRFFIRYEHIHPSIRNGVGMYKEKYTKTGFNPKTGLNTLVERSRLITRSDLPVDQEYSNFLDAIIQDSSKFKTS